MTAGDKNTLRIFTIGHSNRSFEDFLSLLREFEICVVADVRRYPSSRRFPHFNRDSLCELLNVQGIEYLWLEALGGRRHTSPNRQSPNIGLESPGFRNYADHMVAEEFKAGVRVLLSTAGASRTAIMCAEKFYWKCHRRLLSDLLVAQAAQITHIIEPGKAVAHKLTPGAVITTNAEVIYPPRSLDQCAGGQLRFDGQL